MVCSRRKELFCHTIDGAEAWCGYLPVSSAARAGEQTPAQPKAFGKDQPSRARRSRWGVSRKSLPLWCIQSLRWSSPRMNSTLGRRCLAFGVARAGSASEAAPATSACERNSRRVTFIACPAEPSTRSRALRGNPP